MDRLQKRRSGFTIIEIMIVLAIAGLIMSIVFLAVPALQRSSRNNERKNDAAAMAETLATFSNDNSGQLPNRIRNDSATMANQVDFANTFNLTSYYKAILSYYNAFTTSDTSWGHDADNVQITEWPTTSLVTPTVLPVSQTNIANCQKNSINAPLKCTLTTETAGIIIGENCNANGAGQLNLGSFAIFYVLEAGSGNGDLECVSQ